MKLDGHRCNTRGEDRKDNLMENMKLSRAVDTCGLHKGRMYRHIAVLPQEKYRTW